MDISITSAPYLRQLVFIIHFTVLFVIAFSAFRSIRSRIFHRLHIGAAFSSDHAVSRFPLHFYGAAFSVLAFSVAPCVFVFHVTMSLSRTVSEIDNVK